MNPCCFDCGKEFNDGDTVFEFTSGKYSASDGAVFADTEIEQWCEDCEQKRGEK